MKAHKRANKMSSEMSCVQALMRIGSDTFREVENPSTDLMRRMLWKEPMAIMRMPQADTTLKIAAIKLDISLLMHDFSWGFDTENYFPGSSVWQHRYREFFAFECFGPFGLGNGVRFTMLALWKPFEGLSTWPMSSLYAHERFFLRYSTFEQNLEMAADLLAKNPGGIRSCAVSMYDDVSASLRECLESTLAD